MTRSLPSWREYLPHPAQARDVIAVAEEKARAHAARLVTMPDEAAAGALLWHAANETARLCVLVHPQEAPEVAAHYEAALDRLVPSLPRATEPALAGTLTFLEVAEMYFRALSRPPGRDVLETAFARLVHFTEQGGPSRDDAGLDARASLAYVALAHGRTDLARGLSADPWLRKLADGIDARSMAPFYELLDAVPSSDELEYCDLALAARAFVVHVLGRAVSTAGAWLRRSIHEGHREAVRTSEPPSVPAPSGPVVLRHVTTIELGGQSIGALVTSPNGRHVFAIHGNVWRGSLRPTGSATFVMRTEAGFRSVKTVTPERTYVLDEGRAVLVRAPGHEIQLVVVDETGVSTPHGLEGDRRFTLSGSWRVGPRHAVVVARDQTTLVYDEHDREIYPERWRLIELATCRVVSESPDRRGIDWALAGVAVATSPPDPGRKPRARQPRRHRLERELAEGRLRRLTSLRVLSLATAEVELEVAQAAAVETSPRHDELFAISHDETLVAGRSSEGELVVWDLVTGAKLVAPVDHGKVESAIFTGPTSSELLAGTAAGELVSFDVTLNR